MARVSIGQCLRTGANEDAGNAPLCHPLTRCHKEHITRHPEGGLGSYSSGGAVGGENTKHCEPNLRGEKERVCSGASKKTRPLLSPSGQEL